MNTDIKKLVDRAICKGENLDFTHVCYFDINLAGKLAEAYGKKPEECVLVKKEGESKYKFERVQDWKEFVERQGRWLLENDNNYEFYTRHIENKAMELYMEKGGEVLHDKNGPAVCDEALYNEILEEVICDQLDDFTAERSFTLSGLTCKKAYCVRIDD